MLERKNRIWGEHSPNENRPHLLEAEKLIDKEINDADIMIKDICIVSKGEPCLPFSFWSRLAGGPISFRRIGVLNTRDTKFFNTVIMEQEYAVKLGYTYSYAGDGKNVNAYIPVNDSVKFALSLYDDISMALSRYTHAPITHEEVEDIKPLLRNNIRMFQTEIAKYGTISIPVKTTQYNDNDFSPVLISMLDKNIGYENIDEVSDAIYELGVAIYPAERKELYSKYSVRDNEIMRQLTIQLEDNQAITEENFSKLVSLITKIFKIYNKAIVSEYEKMKDDSKYQKRHDLNIS